MLGIQFFFSQISAFCRQIRPVHGQCNSKVLHAAIISYNMVRLSMPSHSIAQIAPHHLSLVAPVPHLDQFGVEVCALSQCVSHRPQRAHLRSNMEMQHRKPWKHP